MLLYTKLAPPRTPKRRSRAGCIYCREKKKKCDEKHPQCSRCVERNVECGYETIKPRQRRKRDSQSVFKAATPSEFVSSSDVYEWQKWECCGPLETKANNSPLSYKRTDTCDDSTTPSDEPDVDDSQYQDRQLVRRESYGACVVPSSTRSLRPDLAMIAPCPVNSPTLEFSIPAFSEFSNRPNRRALVDHFCNVLSHLIVFREDSGNPFQQLVLPLSHSSLPVMNAIYALASAHLEYRGVRNSEKSLYFHDQAIQGLASIIKDQVKVNKNELLAAIILLVYYEVLVQRGRTNIINGHLKGAFAIMCLNQDLTPVGLFLERAFGFYDVIAALSLGTPPISTAPSAGSLQPVQPPDAPAASPLSSVDTLLGMATTLWPIMHRLSNLLSMKKELEDARVKNQTSKVAVLRTEYEATSQAIEAALTRWEPCLPPNISIRDDVLVVNGSEKDKILQLSRLQSILHNAFAYRHSAFVYLYRTIYGFSPKHELVQRNSHAALHHCVRTTAARGPMGALLWPLFAAACEAINTEDRELAKKAFSEIEQRQGMTNIEEAWAIVQEVWRRLDMPDNDPATVPNANLWRDVCAEIGVTIVFG
ncbi:hypothetical protein GGS21DRAFT_534619 [Xylaria nigripes]|nr:hypothetical protein GGS21DRAFT_534619 [Xylaria nigripes]